MCLRNRCRDSLQVPWKGQLGIYNIDPASLGEKNLAHLAASIPAINPQPGAGGGPAGNEHPPTASESIICARCASSTAA